MTIRQTPISQSMPKHFADEMFRLACSEPYLWIRKARELRVAADILWQQFEEEVRSFPERGDSAALFTGDVAMMLYGLAIENLLKGGLVAHSSGETLANGRFKLKSHRLREMAGNLSVVRTPEEDELLEKLEQFIDWAGRYPIPLSRQGLYPRDLLDGSKGALYGLSTGDKRAVENVLAKIENVIPSEEQALERYAHNYRASSR